MGPLSPSVLKDGSWIYATHDEFDAGLSAGSRQRVYLKEGGGRFNRHFPFDHLLTNLPALTRPIKQEVTWAPAWRRWIALNTLTGEIFGRNMARHRHQEFIRFLNALERENPAGKKVHVVLDNVATHKTPEVMCWLERHPLWTFHFTPTAASWVNAVEGFFAKLTKRRLKRGVFCSLVDLQAAINRFIAEHNEKEAKPFTWRADPDDIIAARTRGFQSLESLH